MARAGNKFDREKVCCVARDGSFTSCAFIVEIHTLWREGVGLTFHGRNRSHRHILLVAPLSLDLCVDGQDSIGKTHAASIGGKTISGP